MSQSSRTTSSARAGSRLATGSSARTLVVSLHDFDLAVRRCDRVVGLRHGEVRFDLPAGEVGPELRDALYALDRA